MRSSDPTFDPLAVPHTYKSTIRRAAHAHFLALAKINSSFFSQFEFQYRGTSTLAQKHCDAVVKLFCSVRQPPSLKPLHPDILGLSGKFEHKKPGKRQTQAIYFDLVEQIESLLSQQWIHSAQWAWFHTALLDWHTALVGKLTLLFQQTAKQQTLHQRKGVHLEDGFLRLIDPLPQTAPLTPSSQSLLTTVSLQEQEFFTPNVVRDFQIGNPNRARNIAKLKFHFPVAIFLVSPGGSHPPYFAIWKTDPSLEHSVNYQKSQRLSTECCKIPKKLTRADKRDLFERTSNLTPFDRRLVYLGHDIALGATEECALTKKQRQSLEYLLDTGDYDSLGRDLRAVTTNPSIFDPFWKSLTEYISEFEVRAERRRKNNKGFIPICFSIPNLIDRVCDHHATKHGSPLTPSQVPHAQTVRTSFEPKRITAATSYFSGRYKLQHLMQLRDLRKHNDHAYYCYKLWNNLTNFSSSWSNDLAAKNSVVKNLILSLDDKATISIGEDEFLQSGVRQKAAYTPSGLRTHAADHDCDKSPMKLIISLIEQLQTNPEHTAQLLHGPVSYCLHDNLTTPSNPYFHHELLSTYITDVHSSIPLGLLLTFTDGGHDHNTKFPTVRFSDLVSFLQLQPDCFIHARCAGGQSAVNKVETMMSVVNLALHGVSTQRSPLATKHLEKFFKTHKLKRLRDRIQLQEAFHDEVRQAAETTSKDIHSNMCYLKSQGTPFHKLSVPHMYHSTESPTTPSDSLPAEPKSDIQLFISQLSPHISRCLDRLGLSNASGLDVKKATPILKQFLDDHTVFTSYSSVFWKCNDPQCPFCSPVNSPLPVFETFKTIKAVNPVPVPNAPSEKYFNYPLTCQHPLRTSANLPKKSGEFKPPISLTQKNIVGYCRCVDCKLFRCVFKNPTCSIEPSVFFADLNHSVFTCTSIIDPDDNYFIDRRVECQQKIKQSFYIKFVRNKGVPPLFPQITAPCLCCGAMLSPAILVDFNRHHTMFGQVRPTCRPLGKRCRLAGLHQWTQNIPLNTLSIAYLKNLRNEKIAKRVDSLQDPTSQEDLTS